MYQLHKTNSVVGWVPLDYMDIITIKSALIAFMNNPNPPLTAEEDQVFINSVQSIWNRISSLEQ
jgi:hypothetical protein